MRNLFLLLPLALAAGSTPRERAAAPQEAAATPEKKLAALIERYNKQDNDVFAAYQKATSDDEKAKILSQRPGKEYVPEFRAIAEEAKGTDTAVKAWLWVLKLNGSDPKEAKRIVDLLLKDHMQSEALGELTGRLQENASVIGRGPATDALRALVADSPHERVRAAALFSLGQLLLQSPRSEDKAEGRDCFQALVAEYGDVSNGDTTYGKVAESTIFELEHLQIGMTAPDFEATDENGAKWRLSDYRGKVVVIDFWGFW